MTTIRTELPDSGADQLWTALVRARTGATPLTCAHTEDAVFRFYLPMARTMARQAWTGMPDAAASRDADQAAELGLAEAVLGWRQPDSAGFERYARAAISGRLQRLSARKSRAGE